MQNSLRTSLKIMGTLLCFSVIAMGCMENDSSADRREAIRKINSRKLLSQSKYNKGKRVGVKKKEKGKITKIVGEVNDIKVVNSGSDDNNIVLEWTTSDLKGISGNFDIFRSFGDRAVEHIAKTKIYDGKKNANQFIWIENDKNSGVYTDLFFQNEDLLPLKNFKFQVQFKPLNTKKYRNSSISNESVGYLVPKNAEIAMNDIVENLQFAHQEDCGFFTHFEPKDRSISRKGNFSGFYIREVENNDTVTYSFKNYSHVGAIYINGNLISHIQHYQNSDKKPAMKPMSVSGTLNIDGIYKATVKVSDLEFSDQCSKTPKNGTISINYKHPHHGNMKAGFKGLLIPRKLLYSESEWVSYSKKDEDENILPVLPSS